MTKKSSERPDSQRIHTGRTSTETNRTRTAVVAVIAAISGAIAGQTCLGKKDDLMNRNDCLLIRGETQNVEGSIMNPLLQKAINRILSGENKNLLYFPDDDKVEENKDEKNDGTPL